MILNMQNFLFQKTLNEKKGKGMIDSKEVITKLIEFNKKNLNNECCSNEKILIPVYPRNDSVIEMYSFIADYLKSKYHCSISGYVRDDLRPIDVEYGVIDIYKTFTDYIIDPVCNNQQVTKARKITEKIWNHINDFEDWNHIFLFGIDFSISIIRDYLRHNILYIDPKDLRLKDVLFNQIQTIIFWHDYFENNDIKMVVLQDGVGSDSYIREFALSKHIPCYIVYLDWIDKPFHNYFIGLKFRYYDKFWNELSESEKDYGYKWAQKVLNNRINGRSINDNILWNSKKSPFSKKKNKRILPDDGKLKIIICAHIFDEDCYAYGNQLFDNNYISWYKHIGELSERYPEYGWYLKKHPWSDRETGRDTPFINKLVERYRNIHILPDDVVINQLYDEGVRYALTIFGTVGHEYPCLGINVINAGHNQHECFDINLNPKTKEEFDDIIAHLKEIDYKYDEKDMYKFYAINDLYYDTEFERGDRFFFIDKDLCKSDFELQAEGKDIGVWRYEKFLDEFTPDRVQQVKDNMPELFKTIDNMDKSHFYKRKVEIDK